MLTIRNYINTINKFLLDLYTNEETSKTELMNFFNAYVKYILLCNELPADDISVQIHFIPKEKLNYEDQEFKLKEKRMKKQKQRNKENAKKEQFKKGSRNLAYMTCSANLNEFDIYLDEKLCKIKCLEDVNNLIELISDLGHEAEHVIQSYRQAALFFAVELGNKKN